MKQMFNMKSLLRAAAAIMVASVSVTAAEPAVQQHNGKSYYLTGSSAEIATWKYGALGVYTTIHDDWGSTSISGVYTRLDTMNANRGLGTSSAVIAGSCDGYYTTLGKEFIRHGHELHSHSVTHTAAATGREEIVNSKKDLEAKLGVPVEFYVFPFDQWNDAAKTYLREAGYIGARSGDRQPRIDAGNAGGYVPNMCNDANFPDGFELQFDVFPRSNSAYKNVPDNGDPTAFMKRYVKDAIDSKGWAIQEFHDINTQTTSLTISETDYRSLLDSVYRAKEKNEIWASGPTEVIRYRFAREYAGAPSVMTKNGGLELTFGAPKDAAKLNKYHTPLTVFFRAPEMTAHIAATQNGIVVPSRKIADGYFALEADPTLGAVSIVSAPKPWMAYPFRDPMDTIPSSLPEWNSFTVYANSGAMVYHAGAEYRAQYWTQGNNPSNGAPWNLVKTVAEKVLHTRVSKGGKIAPLGKQLVAPGSSHTVTITPDSGYEIDYVNVNGVNVGSVSSWTFTNVNKSNTIEAILSPKAAVTGPTWTVTATATTGGTITPAGAKSVANGGSQSYAIAANSGNRIDSVVVDGVNKGAVTAYSFTNVIDNHAIKAYFSALPTFAISASVNGNGSITPAGTVSVVEGGSQSYAISAASGSRLDSVVVDGANKGSVTAWNFTNVREPHAIAAYFTAIPTYTVVTAAQGTGTVTPAGTTTLNEGGSLSVKVKADAGARIDSVLINGTKAALDTVYSFANVRANQTLTAFFSPIPKYSINASATAGGTITPAGTVIVNEGDSKTFTASANNGYTFTAFLVNSDSVKTATHTFNNVRAPQSIKAIFAAVPVCTLTVVQTTGGTIAPSTTVVNKGANQTVTITPNTGYTIADVQVNGASVGAVTSYTFTGMNASATITATYAIKTYVITASAGANGTITPAGTKSVNHGASQSYTIAPALNYEIDKLTVNGAVVPSATTYTFSSVTAPQTISVTFKATVIGDGCSGVQAWSASTPWTSYKVGDKRTDAGKLWQCTSVAYSYYQPSSVNGKYGWKQIGTCN